MKRLTGKTVLVTGGGAGIGFSIASLFAAEGASVVLADISEGVHQAAATLNGRGLVMNVADGASVRAAAESLASEGVEIDIVVNNAGITRDTLLIRMAEEDWEKVIDVNLNSAFLVSKAFVRGMMKKRWGRIINIASVVGQMGNAGQTNYGASKAGMIGFTKSLAREVASRNVTVNAIAPGYIQTAMTDKLPEEAKQALMGLIPMTRLGLPEDVAKAALFLASEDASYITGQVVAVNGGMYM
jgi:3-oxoacyl-[acyl-carrier protein] reductase